MTLIVREQSFIRSFHVTLLALFVSIGLDVLNHHAHAEDDVQVPSLEWSFSGPLGQFDRAQLQRGLKVYRQVCASCHALRNVSFRNLTDLGYSDIEIRAIAAEYQIEDGPNDDGELYFRAGLPSDRFPDPYENDAQARAVNLGAYPVNLSTIIRARSGGADYVAALMTGYEDPPADVTLTDGQYYNRYYPSNVLAMAQQLNDGLVTYEDGTQETSEQYAKDVTAFLVWSNEPSLIERKQLGAKVLTFLLFLLIVAILYQRSVWRRLKH